MPGAPTPQTLLEAIAADATSEFITHPMPEAPTGGNAASIQGGFPPITMTEESAGGEAPLGQDMNGYLFLISSHTLYVEAGQTYKYSAALSTALGGYAIGTILGMTDDTGIWLNTVDGNTNNPDTGGAGWVPMAAYGFTSVTGLVGGVVTLTPAQTKYNVIVLAGTLAGNLTLIFPQTVQQWLIINRTTGAFTTTVKTAASGSIGQTVPQGGYTAPVSVYSVGDGNLYPTVAPLSVPFDQNPTPLTLVERTNAGYVLATYFNGSAGVENQTAAQVITSNGDGFFRKNSLTNFESQMLLQGIGGQVSNGQVPYSAIAQWASTLFSSPTFTGVPTAPTAAAGTSDAQVATTQFANPGVVSNANGICITLPNLYKIQFGAVNPNGGTVAITWPVPFVNSVFGPWGVNTSGGSTQFWKPSAATLTGAQVANTGGSSHWISIGQ